MDKIYTTDRENFRKYTDNETFDKIVSYGTVGEMWKDCINKYAALTAIEDDGKKYTYGQLEEDASYFRPLLGEGKRAAVLCPNSYEFVKAYLAAVTSGNTAVILPPQLPADAVYGCCMKLGANELIYHPALEEKLATVKTAAPQLPLINVMAKADKPEGVKDSQPDDPCAVMFTGGTTGRSKGALLSHRAVMEGTVNGCYGYKEVFNQRYLLVLPLSHVFGLIRNLMTSLYTGSALYICRNNKDMFRDIALFRPTVLVLVPALAEMALMLSYKFGKNMLGPDLKYIICGAAAVSPYLIREYYKTGVLLLAGYGLTESANLVSGNPDSIGKPESVGIPFPNQTLRVVDGELWLKGDNMMDGYVNEPEESKAAYEDGWFKTGDLVRIDDGFLYITGRSKEIIVLSNGENVSPAEVEARFNAPSFIQDSQVFEDVLPNGGHILALEVVPRMPELKGVEGNVKEYIISELEKINKELPPYQRVSRIEVRDTDFERTPSMKIVRYRKCK
ncbi:MAG: acyl--CoA ligase [Clostridia bacterium]|nr:acyl--CoA ligase [Clostridia bacterium]